MKKSTLSGVDDAISLITYFLIRKGGMFVGFPCDIKRGIDKEIVNPLAKMRMLTSTSIGKWIKYHKEFFNSLFVLSYHKHGSRTRYVFGGMRNGVTSEDVNVIRQAIEKKFTRDYSRVVRISPFRIADEILECPATLLKESEVSK